MPVYAGIKVLASAAMARRLAAAIPDIDIPGWLAGQVTNDKMARVEAACERSPGSATAAPSTRSHLSASTATGKSSARLEALA